MTSVPIIRRQEAPVAFDIGVIVFWLVVIAIAVTFWLWVWRGLEGWI